jgi:outer membrane protein OmpA-like peptidoglycan-associated protein
MPQPFMLPQPVPYQTFLAQFAPAQAVPVAAPPAAPAPIAAAPAQPATTTQQAVPSPTTTTPAPTAVAANTAPSSPAVPAPAAPAAVSTVVPLTATPLPEVTSPSATQAAPAAAQAIPGTVVHFEFDSAELNNSGRLVLNGWLMDVPKDLPLRLTGHSDRLGPETYNLSLSQRRAMTVQQYLVEKGMKSEAMQIMAKGEKAPVIKCKGGATPATKTCLAPNRRVEVDPR